MAYSCMAYMYGVPRTAVVLDLDGGARMGGHHLQHDRHTPPPLLCPRGQWIPRSQDARVNRLAAPPLVGAKAQARDIT